MNIDWAQKFTDSDLMDQIIVYRLREAIVLNQVAMQSLENKAELEDYEKEDLEDCRSWANSLQDVYSYFGGSLFDEMV